MDPDVYLWPDSPKHIVKTGLWLMDVLNKLFSGKQYTCYFFILSMSPASVVAQCDRFGLLIRSCISPISSMLPQLGPRGRPLTLCAPGVPYGIYARERISLYYVLWQIKAASSLFLKRIYSGFLSLICDIATFSMDQIQAWHLFHFHRKKCNSTWARNFLHRRCV